MKIHELKCWPQFFEAIVEGRKTFELRKNDRDFKKGDVLLLREWEPSTKEYTHRMCGCVISYLVEGSDFNINGALQYGFVCMSIRVFDKSL